MAKKTDAKKADTKKDAKPKKPSYQTIIMDTLAKGKGVATREALMKATGADSRNLSVAVSILKNGKRTKEPADIRYLRGNKTFYLFPMAEKAATAAAEALDAAKKKAAADKKAAAKKDDKKKAA